MKSIYAILAITLALVAVANAQSDNERYRKAREAVLDQHPELRVTSNAYEDEVSFLVHEDHNNAECSKPILIKAGSAVDTLIADFIKGTKTAEAAVYEEINGVFPTTIKQLQTCLVVERSSILAEKLMEDAELRYLKFYPEEAKRLEDLQNEVFALFTRSSPCVIDWYPKFESFEKSTINAYYNGESIIDEIVHETVIISAKMVEDCKLSL